MAKQRKECRSMDRWRIGQDSRDYGAEKIIIVLLLNANASAFSVRLGI